MKNTKVKKSKELKTFDEYLKKYFPKKYNMKEHVSNSIKDISVHHAKQSLNKFRKILNS